MGGIGAMAPLPEGFTYGQWNMVYNALSFGIAGMGSATIFFWLQLPNVRKNYRTALTITGLVTFIATYHYIRIFNSWVDAFSVSNSEGGGDYKVALSGTAFNDAYRYVDWLLTVPLLLIELILVMKLPVDQTVSMSRSLGLASAAMVDLGYRCGPLFLVGTGHVAIHVRRVHTPHRAERGHEQAAGVSKGPHCLGEVPDCHLVAHISLRVHDQDGWPRRSLGHRLRAGRLLDCRCRRQGGVRCPHLGHRGSQVRGGGPEPPGLISSRFVFVARGANNFLHRPVICVFRAPGCWQK